MSVLPGFFPALLRTGFCSYIMLMYNYINHLRHPQTCWCRSLYVRRSCVLKVAPNYGKQYGELTKTIPCKILKHNQFIYVCALSWPYRIGLNGLSSLNETYHILTTRFCCCCCQWWQSPRMSHGKLWTPQSRRCPRSGSLCRWAMVQENGTDMKNVEQLGGNSNIFNFHPWGNDPIWLIFFKWLETTKLKIIGFVSYFVSLIICFFHFGSMPGQEPDGELCGKLQFLWTQPPKGEKG